MNQNNPEIWAQTAQQFQQTLSESWSKAMQSFQGLDLSGVGVPLPAAGASLPQVSFAPEKLQELQQQYLKDALGLWTNGLQGAPIANDKRFAAEAWGANPMSALAAST